MEYTKNFKLSKPSYDDDVDVQILNTNMDILDNQLGNLDYLPLNGGTMRGDIKFPLEKGFRYDPSTVMKFIIENDLKTMRFEGERISFSTPSGETLKIDYDDFKYKNNLVICDKGTSFTKRHSGYCKLNNRLMIQWGYVENGPDDGNLKLISLPQPFTSNLYSVVVSKSNGLDGMPTTLGGSFYSMSYSLTNTNFWIVADSNDTGKYTFWIAIGETDLEG